MKRMIPLILLFLCSVSLAAQSMRTVFVSMPDSLAPLLTKVNKEDCIDFLDSQMKAEVKNRMGKTVEMKQLTDDYVLMQTSSVSTLEMKLLPVNDSTRVVCMVKTVCGPVCDSAVRFYDTSWKSELDAASFLKLPEADAFYLPKDSLSETDLLVLKKADMHLMKASLSADEATLSFEYTTPAYLNKEDCEKLQPFLRKEPVVLRWKDGRFE